MDLTALESTSKPNSLAVRHRHFVAGTLRVLTGVTFTQSIKLIDANPNALWQPKSLHELAQQINQSRKFL